MSFTISSSVSALTVFLQGLFSFFSPCVLPLLPVYMAYLAGNVTGDGSGNASEDSSENVAGDASEDASGNVPEGASGDASKNASGNVLEDSDVPSVNTVKADFSVPSVNTVKADFSTPSGNTAEAGFSAPSGNTAEAGFSAPSGNTAEAEFFASPGSAAGTDFSVPPGSTAEAGSGAFSGKTGNTNPTLLSGALPGTLCFVLGISAAFFSLGLGMTAAGSAFSGHRLLIARIGGVLVILLGLLQTGIFRNFNTPFLMKEARLPFYRNPKQYDPARPVHSALRAFLLGFVFSFSWTPCVGPALTTVLLMAASADSRGAGLFLIGIYTLGFSIPFLLTGIFTDRILSFFKKNRGIVRYTTVFGGLLLIIMGLYMFSGKMTAGIQSSSAAETKVDSTVSSAAHTEDGSAASPAADTEDGTAASPAADTEGGTAASPTSDTEGGTAASPAADTEDATATSPAEGAADTDGETTTVYPAYDFSLYDQYGTLHTLSDYRGKVVFLNFWATWCPPCRAEMPDLQALYEEYYLAGDDSVVFLGVAGPGLGSEGSEKDITDFLAENGYTYPVVMDTTGELFQEYFISAYPTTFMIDPEGNIYGYVTGSLSKENMEDIIAQTKAGR